jgi:pyridinium-3,5-biscarboxylic acid mononucleotide synthase
MADHDVPGHSDGSPNQLDHALIDLARTERIGMPEAIYCQGKTVAQCVDIVNLMLGRGSDCVIATRCTEPQAEALRAMSPTLDTGTTLTWRHRAATGRRSAVVCGGTSDLPIVEEAAATLSALGHSVDRHVDVGVAGLHRLLSALPAIRQAEVIIAIAGMEGALATVLGGLVAAPIIAVPASAGYGASFEGVTAMLGMLASCSPGISVVGIDNGYGAACAAHRILGIDLAPQR